MGSGFGTAVIHLIYGASISTLLALLLYHASLCISKYSEGPTYMKTSVQEQAQSPPPVFTVCPERKYKKDALSSAGVNDSDAMEDWEYGELPRGMQRGQVYDTAAFRAEDLVHKAYNRFFLYVPQLNAFYIEILSPKDITTEVRHPHLGRCFTICFPKEYQSFGNYYLKVWYNEEVRIYFHKPNQFLKVTNHQQGYKMTSNTTMQSQLTYTEVRLLQKASSENPCSEESYDDCMTKAIAEEMMRELGCVSPWLSQMGMDPCEESGKAKRAWDLGKAMLLNASSICDQPCSFNIVQIGARNKFNTIKDPSGNATSLQYIYYPPRILLQEESHLYSFLSMIAEIGGYVGLLLGVSFREIYTLTKITPALKKCFSKKDV